MVALPSTGARGKPVGDEQGSVITILRYFINLSYFDEFTSCLLNILFVAGRYSSCSPVGGCRRAECAPVPIEVIRQSANGGRLVTRQTPKHIKIGGSRAVKLNFGKRLACPKYNNIIIIIVILLYLFQAFMEFIRGQ